MKKIFLSLLVSLFIVSFFAPVFADRDTPTTATYTTSTLIQRGDWKVYRIYFVATSNAGSFTILDSLTETVSTSTIKAEASEATASNSKVLDFSNKPLEGSTGLYLIVNAANVVVEYE